MRVALIVDKTGMRQSSSSARKSVAPSFDCRHGAFSTPSLVAAGTKPSFAKASNSNQRFAIHQLPRRISAGQINFQGEILSGYIQGPFDKRLLDSLTPGAAGVTRNQTRAGQPCNAVRRIKESDNGVGRRPMVERQRN
jgi:hypothetical protein